MKYLMSSLLMAILIIVGCQESKTTLESGFDYKFYKDAAGANAQPGEFVFFDMDIIGDDGATLQTMRGKGAQPSIQIPTTEVANVYKKNPILDVLRYASIGDSLGIFIPVDSIPNPSPEFAGMKHFEYRVAVKNIMSEADAKKKTEDEAAALKLASSKELTRVVEVIKGDLDGYNAKSLGDKLIKDLSGVEYIIHDAGEGAAINDGDVVKVHYYGSLLDGNSFDNSFKRGSPYDVTVGRSSVIDGWHKGLALLNYGSKATIFIPYEMAYGEGGRPPQIPGKAKLAFYMEVQD